MESLWLKNNAGLKEGIEIINNVDNVKFEQVLNRITGKIKLKDPTIFSDEEKHKLEKIFQIEGSKLELGLRTTIFIIKKITKYVFKPSYLKKDLLNIGMNNEKANAFVKVWSLYTKDAVNDLEPQKAPSFSWKLNAELSSDICKKSKIPKAYVMFSETNKNIEVEFQHSELYSMFLQMEAVQHALDNLM